MRLDQYLVELKKVRSRTQAKEIIQNLKIKVDGRLISKPSFLCSEDSEIEILNEEDLDWVARSGEKLYGALQRFDLNLSGKTCLDVGQSTGGFTQAMLKCGAETVVGVDVGKGQLSEEVRSLPNVHCYESFDARDLAKLKGDWKIDFFAVDVSFISILKIFKGITGLLGPSDDRVKVQALLLIKPQFEVGKKNVKKGGLVESPLIHLECEKETLRGLEKMGVEILDYIPSSVKGRDGNQEFICYISM